MIPEMRLQFDSRWSPEAYQFLMNSLTRDCGGPIPFRVSETPVFFERELLEKMARYG